MDGFCSHLANAALTGMLFGNLSVYIAEVAQGLYFTFKLAISWYFCRVVNGVC